MEDNDKKKLKHVENFREACDYHGLDLGTTIMLELEADCALADKGLKPEFRKAMLDCVTGAKIADEAINRMKKMTPDFTRFSLTDILGFFARLIKYASVITFIIHEHRAAMLMKKAYENGTPSFDIEKLRGGKDDV